MPNLTYKVVPAPSKGRRGSGVKGVDGRYANALEMVLNEMAEQGWSYVRAESLPSHDRVGMTRRVVETYQNVLVFSKVVEEQAEVAAPAVFAPVVAAPLPVEPELVTPDPVDTPDPVVVDAPEDEAEEDAPRPEAV